MFDCSVDGYPIHDKAKIQPSLAVKLRLGHSSVITRALGISLWLGCYLSVVHDRNMISSISSAPFSFISTVHFYFCSISVSLHFSVVRFLNWWRVFMSLVMIFNTTSLLGFHV